MENSAAQLPHNTKSIRGSGYTGSEKSDPISTMNYLGNVIGFTDHLSLIEAKSSKWFIFM